MAMKAKALKLSLVYVLAGAAILATAATVVLTSGETMLRTSFNTALNNVNLAAPKIANRAPVSGSEDYWLSAMRADGVGPVTKTISVGDKISLSFGGERRTLRVASVSEFSPQITEIDTTSGPNRFVLVTALDAADRDARPIRFIMDVAGTPAPVAKRLTGRTL
jgi:hypothetical protein